jgi:Zn-dependent peptidase ImmA (M78 family)
MEINHDSIADTALEVLEKYEIAEPVVDVLKIARGEGIQVKELDLTEKYADVAGFYNDEDKTIYVQAGDPPSRKLFTIAHELGHIFLKHPNYSVLYRIPRNDTKYRWEEKEANSFAAHLLMPDFLLKEYLAKYSLTTNDYLKMSKFFGVPPTAMKNALMNARDYLAS